MSLASLGVKLTVRRCVDGDPLPVLTTPGGKQYFVSEEGCEYEVELQTGPTFPLVHHPAVLRASLYVDGQPVGYNYPKLKPNSSYVYEGFCISASEHGASTYRRFKFSKADPSRDMGPQVNDPEHIKAGRITVKIARALPLGTRSGPIMTGVESGGGNGGGAALGHLPEGKKFFLAPSLKTAQGQQETKATMWSTTTYQTVETLGVMELRYETASTLMLRKALDKDNPAHRQLLRDSRDPTVLALLGEDGDEGCRAQPLRERQARCPGARAGAGGGGGAKAAVSVKRERGAAGAAAAAAAPGMRVKREHGAGGGGGGGGGGSGDGGSGGSVFLDLTKPQEMTLRVGGREVQRNEIAVCDLLDSDGEEGARAPRWEVRKRQAVEIVSRV